MDVGSYLTTTVTVPEGDAGTSAEYLVVHPNGETDSGSGTPSVDFQTWTANVLIQAAGWGRSTWTVTGPGAGVKHSRWFAVAAPTAWGVWPPCLADLKVDMGRDAQQDATDQQLAMVLDAAIAWVVDRKLGDINFGLGEESESELSDPNYNLILGTLRLAGRWHLRRRSPDGMVSMGDQGTSRVTTFDPDIDKLLRVGRYAPMRFA